MCWVAIRRKKGNHIIASSMKKKKCQKEDKLENTTMKAFQLLYWYRNIFPALSSSEISSKKKKKKNAGEMHDRQPMSGGF